MFETVQFIKENISKFKDDDRRKYLTQLMKLLSPSSRGELLRFQSEWKDEMGGPDLFFKRQNDLILNCIEAEIRMGSIKENTFLVPITMNFVTKEKFIKKIEIKEAPLPHRYYIPIQSRVLMKAWSENNDIISQIPNEIIKYEFKLDKIDEKENNAFYREV